jgi:hypothetical protein
MTALLQGVPLAWPLALSAIVFLIGLVGVLGATRSSSSCPSS